MKQSGQPGSGCPFCAKEGECGLDNRLILEALNRYGLEGTQWSLIRHNENMTVNVEDRYLLRIHQHAEGFSTDAYDEGLDRIALRRRELAFLSHLASRGMTVQTPVANQQGDLITLLPGKVCATLLRWIPGRTPTGADIANNVYFHTGSMTARMHKAAAGFSTDQLLRYDASMCRRMRAWLAKAHQDGLLAAEHTDTMQAACQVMEDRLDGGEHIVVHADLCSNNILVTDGGLVPIDFSLMGIGHPMMDIGSLFCSVNGIEARQQIADGYRSEGGVISSPELDACFALNILLYIALHLHAGNTMTASINRWCSHTFGPLAKGGRLMDDTFRMLHVPD